MSTIFRENMDTPKDDIYSLIAKSFVSELDGEEQLRLNNWISEDPSNINELNDITEIWMRSADLSRPSHFNLSESLKSTQRKAGMNKRKIHWMSLIRQAAAVLILAVMFSSVYNLRNKPVITEKSKVAVYQEVKASYGTQTQVVLPDGTMVRLNSGSSLKFPSTFHHSKSRLVYLSGEGNFSVAKNSEQPFIVDVNKLQINVLGTTFNVDAYPGNTSVTVALVEGKVLLQQVSNNQVSDLMEMKPNQVAFFKNSDNKLEYKTESNLVKYTAWTDGKIVFSDDPIHTVIQKLEHWYNVEIELADTKLENYRFTGTFIDEPLEQVLSILNLSSQMQYQVIPAKKQKDNSFSKRKIILKSKINS